MEHRVRKRTNVFVQWHGLPESSNLTLKPCTHYKDSVFITRLEKIEVQTDFCCCTVVKFHDVVKQAYDSRRREVIKMKVCIFADNSI